MTRGSQQLTDNEVVILGVACVEGSGRDLARRFQDDTGRKMSPGTLYPLITRMTSRGLLRLTRTEDDADGRLRFLQTSAKGQRVLRAELERRAEVSRIAEMRLGEATA